MSTVSKKKVDQLIAKAIDVIDDKKWFFAKEKDSQGICNTSE